MLNNIQNHHSISGPVPFPGHWLFFLHTSWTRFQLASLFSQTLYLTLRKGCPSRILLEFIKGLRWLSNMLLKLPLICVWINPRSAHGHNWKSGMFVCLCLEVRVILYCDPFVFCVPQKFDPVPNFTKRNPLVYRSLPYHSRNWIAYRFEFFWGYS